MLKFVSKALLSVVMDKTARDKLEASRKSKDEKTEKPTSPTTSVDAAKPAASNPEDWGTMSRAKPRSTANAGPRPVTPERQALIRQALEIQKTKDDIFDNLSDDTKAKLLIAAVKAMGIPPDDFERGLKRRPNGTPSSPPPSPRKKPR